MRILILKERHESLETKQIYDKYNTKNINYK